MYKSGDVDSGIFKFGTDCINEFKAAVHSEEPAVSFIVKRQVTISTNSKLF